jgi:hypothetical protein
MVGVDAHRGSHALAVVHVVFFAASSRNAPAASAHALVGLHRSSGRKTSRGQHPINHLVAGHDPRT